MAARVYCAEAPPMGSLGAAGMMCGATELVGLTALVAGVSLQMQADSPKVSTPGDEAAAFLGQTLMCLSGGASRASSAAAPIVEEAPGLCSELEEVASTSPAAAEPPPTSPGPVAVPKPKPTPLPKPPAENPNSVALGTHDGIGKNGAAGGGPTLKEFAKSTGSKIFEEMPTLKSESFLHERIDGVLQRADQIHFKMDNMTSIESTLQKGVP